MLPGLGEAGARPLARRINKYHLQRTQAPARLGTLLDPGFVCG